MAGYRPKSLDELNEMYDKTITAEKAIIKATKQLHDATETIVPSELHTEKPEAIKKDTAEVEEFSSEVDSLINCFKEEIKTPQIKEVVKTEIPEMEEPVFPTVPENISFEKEPEPASEPAEPIVPIKESAAVAPVVQSRSKVYYSLETPDELQQKANAKSEERTDLFNDYMKIMNDEDDDFFSNRDSFKKKDKKKKHKKGLFFRHEPKAEEIEEDETLAEDESDEKLSSDSSDALPLNEVVYTPEVPETNEDFKVEFYAENNEDTETEEFSLFDEASADETDEDFSEEETETDEQAAYEKFASHSGFDILPDESDELSHTPEEIEDNAFDEYVNSSEDIYSYDPSKKNTIPEYDQEQYNDDDNVQEEGFYEEDEPAAEPPKNKKGIVAGRVLLSIVLAILTVLATGIIGINTLLGVNTGKTAFDEKFIFTASQNYSNSNILEGDLIVTEKRYANDGEVFAYINYTQQCFMFGKRNGSIVNDSGDVLFIAENDGERVLVLRDDTRGVVTATYPGIGKIVSVCTDYFIPMIAAVLLLGLIIVLLLAFVFKDKEKAYKKMMKKMIKKGVISAEEAEYDFSEDSEEEDLFSTIE